MSSEVLVTVVGKGRRGDVCLDDGVPIGALLLDLERHYGAGTGAGDELVLTDDSGAVLDSNASLHDAGVGHGAKLTLRTRAEALAAGSPPTRTRPWARRAPVVAHGPAGALSADQVAYLASPTEEASDGQPVYPPAQPLLGADRPHVFDAEAEADASATPASATPASATPATAPPPPPAPPGWPPPPASAPTEAYLPAPERPITPIERTRQMLPERVSTVRRLQHSIGAAAGRHQSAPNWSGRALGAAPSPAELTLPDAPGPISRWRRSWEETDYVKRLENAIIRPHLARCARVAIVSPKGGVGKTTTTALLGTLIAHLRRDFVVAVDANPDYGSLGRVLCPTHRFYVDDMNSSFHASSPTLADLNAWLGAGPHGLRVLPAPTDPERMSRIGFGTYAEVIRRMQDYAAMLLVDCGTGLHEPSARAALAAADQVVMVSDSDPATASLVSEAAARIRINAPITLVVNKMPAGGGRLDLDRLAQTLPGVESVVVIPAEPKAALMLGVGAFTWTGVPNSWQRAVRELAAVLIAGWPALGLERT